MSLRKRLAYAGRHFTPTWRYGFNLKSTLAYRRERLSLSGLSVEAARVLDELNRTGIAITTADRLPGVGECFAELAGAIESLDGLVSISPQLPDDEDGNQIKQYGKMVSS